MKVFIGGSKSICSLPSAGASQLQRLIDLKADILVGDCHGADRAVQHFFATANYPKVTVYFSGKAARNNVGNFPQIRVPTTETAGTYPYRRSTDIRMEQECDCGLMLWDGASKGTLQNIIDLIAARKQVLVCINNHIVEYSRAELNNGFSRSELPSRYGRMATDQLRRDLTAPEANTKQNC